MTGYEIIRIRKRLKLSRVELARRSECAVNTIWRIETGRVKQSYAATLARIVAALQPTPSEAP